MLGSKKPGQVIAGAEKAAGQSELELGRSNLRNGEQNSDSPDRNYRRIQRVFCSMSVS